MKTIESRFWSKVAIIPEHSCWEWVGGKNNQGYGQLRHGMESLAHRVSYKIHFFELPKHLCVCHICDNPGCVRPQHLFLGTRKENIKDRDLKERTAKGENHHAAKLKIKEIKEIKYICENHLKSQRQIAGLYKVSRRTIRDVLKNRSWGHLNRTNNQ